MTMMIMAMMMATTMMIAMVMATTMMIAMVRGDGDDDSDDEGR